MPMNNKDYWKARMQVLEDEQYQHSRQYYDDMQKQFRRAAANIRRDIDLWYERLAENNDVSYAEAKKLLKAGELEEFKWSVEDYIKAGRENAIDERWMKELENASARFHISYLEAMKLQIQQHAEVLSAQFEEGMGEYLQKEYAGQFYRTAFEISKGTGVGFNLARLDERRIDMLIKKPWAQDGKIFSDRIWSNKEKLITNLHTELTQCIIRGEPPRLAAERLAKKMNVSKAQAGTLIMTESAAIASASQRECFKELGMEQYEFDATLDGSTCKTCQGMDTKVFQMAQFEVGVTAPPVHPRCRCCVLPHFDDWEEFGISVERAARNPGTDETVYVDGKLSYPEWRARLNGDTRKENADDEKQKVYAAKRAEWKKKHGGDAAEKSDHIETQFDRNGLKEEIQEIRNEKAKLKAKSDELVHEEKVLTQKVYFDLNGTKEEKDRLKQLSEEKKAVLEQIKNAEERIFAKQKIYQEGVSGELVRSGVIEEIKLSKRMTPETVDELERTLIHLKNKYGIMPKGVIFAPMEVTDATVTYNWIDDTIYLSNKFNDLEEYKTVVHKAEDSLREYRAHYKIKERAEERLKWADDTLADKSIKGYDRANAAIAKAEAEIDLNITRAAVREKLSDTLIHEYGHFIHRHAELDYVQKKNVFGMKELGGKMMGGDWKYEINTGYCRAGKIEASKISKYATENPYETFAEGFLAMEKGEKIPESIERVINEATRKATGIEKPILEQPEVIERAKQYGQEILDDYSVIRYGNGSPINDFINRKLGYDKMPRVISETEFDRISKGKTVLYRGVTDSDGMTAREMVEAFKKGDFYASRGIYGNGTYTDTERRVAEYYAYENGAGEIMEMLLAEDARTVDFCEIYSEYEKTGIPKIKGEKPEAFQDILADVGAYAAIKGYDAILLNGFQNKNHVVILNREKVIIKG